LPVGSRASTKHRRSSIDDPRWPSARIRGRLSYINVQLASAQGVEPLDEQDYPRNCGDGWFYDADNAPSMITLCPTSCSRLLALPAGRVELTVGCASRCKFNGCDDGVDNDRDGLIDLADPQCKYSCRNYVRGDHRMSGSSRPRRQVASVRFFRGDFT
jgi:hypothetical protein